MVNLIELTERIHPENWPSYYCLKHLSIENCGRSVQRPAPGPFRCFQNRADNQIQDDGMIILKKKVSTFLTSGHLTIHKISGHFKELSSDRSYLFDSCHRQH